MQSSDPIVVQRPTCPGCTTASGRDVMMSGPMEHPSDPSPDRFFVCDFCGHTMKDRRAKPRVTPR